MREDIRNVPSEARGPAAKISSGFFSALNLTLRSYGPQRGMDAIQHRESEIRQRALGQWHSSSIDVLLHWVEFLPSVLLLTALAQLAICSGRRNKFTRGY